MKKLFSLFMIIALSLTLSACSSEPKVEEVYETYVRGEWVDNVYTNDFLGFSFTLPENWVVASDEELYSMIDSSTEELMTEDMKEQYDKAIENEVAFYDFAVFNVTTGEGIIMSVEDLSKSNLGLLYTEDQYLDGLVKDMESIEEVKFEELERVDGQLSFGKFRIFTASVQDVVTQKYYVMKNGKYMISFMASYANQAHDGVDFVFEQFE